MGIFLKETVCMSLTCPLTDLEKAHMQFIPIGKKALGIEPLRINTINHTPFTQPYQFNYIHYY